MDKRAAYADLHTHTTCSDGSLGPKALVERAADWGVEVIAVADHDTVKGLEEAQAAATSRGVEFVCGVELSITVEGREIHLLAYAIEPSHAALRDHLRWVAEARRDRVWQIVERLRADGIDVRDERLVETVASDTAVGRPHVASALVRGGHVETMEQAFDEYLAADQSAFVSKPEFPAAEALALVHDAGGIGVLAHPGHWTSSRTIRHLVDVGLDGIEIVHPTHDSSLQQYYQRIARGHDLVETGGSDYHGWSDEEEDPLGTVGLSRAQWERFREAVL